MMSLFIDHTKILSNENRKHYKSVCVCVYELLLFSGLKKPYLRIICDDFDEIPRNSTYIIVETAKIY